MSASIGLARLDVGAGMVVSIRHAIGIGHCIAAPIAYLRLQERAGDAAQGKGLSATRPVFDHKTRRQMSLERDGVVRRLCRRIFWIMPDDLDERIWQRS